MLDIGWSEFVLIGVVALIVIGPEDLPKLFRTLGRITARARGMAREFTSAMEDAAKSSGLEEATKSLKEVNSLTSKKALGLDALDRAAERFEKWDPLAPTKDSPKNMSALPDPSAPVPATPPPAAPPRPAASNVEAPALPPAPGVSAPLQPAEEPAPGQRRLHAVRRADRAE